MMRLVSRFDNHFFGRAVLVFLLVSVIGLPQSGVGDSMGLQSKSSSKSTLDIDGNEQFSPLSDGLMVLRSMFGLSGETLINGLIEDNAVYVSPSDIQSRIGGLGNLTDIDGNGSIDALTDGLLILRYMFGLTGDP